MNAISLTPLDLTIAASLLVADALASIVLKLNLHWKIAVSATRMVLQLAAIGFILRWVFQLGHPAVTGLIVMVMVLIAAREASARPERHLKRAGGFWIGLSAISLSTVLTALFALTTALRPKPWYDAHYAIPLAGILLGNILNATSLALDSFLGSISREKAAIEARLCLGTGFWPTITPYVRDAIRRALVPIINQMSAAGVVTLPGIMTGQILAGLDPIEAVKYQILLMFLLSGGSGLAAAITAYLAAWRLTDPRERLRLDRLKNA
ncbi:MAG: iron export ABC transporter permease subunit FetB [Caulobacteraceae bacterium]|nr:iron export ABC transporter permease subunit FetB [Caulobacteraceae bacterium]